MCHGVGPGWRIKAISNVASGWVKKQADAPLLHSYHSYHSLISLSTIIKSFESTTEMVSKVTQQFPQVLKLLARCKVQGGCQWKTDNFDSCLSSEAERERKPKSGTFISKLAKSPQKCITSITGTHYLQRQLTCCPLSVTGDSFWT